MMYPLLWIVICRCLILITHRAEVVSVCLTEFNEKVFVKSIREEGIELGELSMLVKLVKKDDCRWKKLYRKVSLPRRSS